MGSDQSLGHSRAAASPNYFEPDSPSVREFQLAWQRGECDAVEQFFERHPGLKDDNELALRLICEEICLRQEAGRPTEDGELLRRFPQWRAELDLLLACDRLFEGSRRADFPAPGESVGEFQLHAEIGRGANGRVFLATQPSLSDRPLVVKFTPLDAVEHLSLARLQHAGIVPLYLSQDLPERGLRALVMPYLGGASLDAVLSSLADRPAASRSGQDLVDEIARLQPAAAVEAPPPGPAWQLLATSSYVEAVCWIGACLAEALHHAHQRGLVHLDLKPSNVLLAGDGQPMLLDFHLARGPLPAGAAGGEWLGGTAAYMSPEQSAALAGIRAGGPVTIAVDAHSDLYSLGKLLYVALGGPAETEDELPMCPRLRQFNPAVGRSLEDLLARCMAPDPHDRYSDAAALADDLRRHLADLPLRGVANRSLSERWHKWRRRKPQALRRLVTTVALVAVCIGWSAFYLTRQVHDARLALAEGDDLLDRLAYTTAADRFRGGLERLAFVPGQGDLRRALADGVQRANGRRLLDDLHVVVERLQFADGCDTLPADAAEKLDRGCGAVWARRNEIVRQFDADKNVEAATQVRTDLLDLALLWARLRTNSRHPSEISAANRAAVELLAEAEASLGRCPVLDHERAVYAAAQNAEPTQDEHGNWRAAARSVWEHVAWGRSLLHRGRNESAIEEFQQALDEAPQALWPNYYLGVCAYRMKHYDDALAAFSACVALAPRSAECFYNRGLARDASGQGDAALRDFEQALRLDPDLEAATLRRDELRSRVEHKR